ncbi:MAG TPA: DUF3800 domain-containing protein [Nitrososphaera sp.]|jgi:hypothetical protein|nr:DUF3800 domain-containing protein [Nitrososphaera sp.]
MHIYIDESGIFRNPSNQQNIASCLAALVIPSSKKVKLLEEFSVISKSWPKDQGEIKGKLLDENQIRKTVELLQRYDALVEINAIDLGMHTEQDITSFKNNSTNIMFGWATPNHPLKERLIEIAEAYKRTSNQLFVEEFLMLTLIPRIILHSVNYYARRIPKELTSFHWVIDAKEIILTEFERAWSDVIFPSIEFQSKTEPFFKIEGGDYTYFDKFLTRDDKVLDKLVPGASLPKEEIAGLKLEELLGRSFKFQDSKDKLGLQLADIIANAIQRAFNGRLRQDGWEKIGTLMISRDEQIIPFILLEDKHGFRGEKRK